jgi:hypothetical protein
MHSSSPHSCYIPCPWLDLAKSASYEAPRYADEDDRCASMLANMCYRLMLWSRLRFTLSHSNTSNWLLYILRLFYIFFCLQAQTFSTGLLISPTFMIWRCFRIWDQWKIFCVLSVSRNAQITDWLNYTSVQCRHIERPTDFQCIPRDEVVWTQCFWDMSSHSKATTNPFGALKAFRNAIQVSSISGKPRPVTPRQ